MAKGKGGSGSKDRNDKRACGKAAKRHPRSSPAVAGRGKATGRTVGGYSELRIAIRAAKRAAIVSD